MTDVDVNYLFLYYCLAKLRILHILSNTAEGEGGREGGRVPSVEVLCMTWLGWSLHCLAKDSTW